MSASEIDPYEELAQQVRWLRRHAKGLWTALISLAVWCVNFI